METLIIATIKGNARKSAKERVYMLRLSSVCCVLHERMNRSYQLGQKVSMHGTTLIYIGELPKMVNGLKSEYSWFAVIK